LTAYPDVAGNRTRRHSGAAWRRSFPVPSSPLSGTGRSAPTSAARGGSHPDGNRPYTGDLLLAFNNDAYSGNTSDNSGQVTATITVMHA